MFAENLAEVYPKKLDTNLADLPRVEQDAIAEDMRRWFDCEKRFEPVRKAKDKAEERREKTKVRSWLDSLEPEQYRDDMRRRMNALRVRYETGC